MRTRLRVGSVQGALSIAADPTSTPRGILHHRARRSFRAELPLAGWSKRSVWGHDEGTVTWFAELSRDDAGLDDPPIWLSGIPVALETNWDLAVAIGGCAGYIGTEVLDAMEYALSYART